MIPLIFGSFILMAIGVAILGGYNCDKELKAAIFLISVGMFGLILSAILSLFF